MSNAAVFYGCPDVGADTQDLEQLLPQDSITEKAAEKAAASLKANWRAAASFYWASAYLALQDGNRRLAMTCAKQAGDAEYQASPDANLLAAIFGGCESRPADRPVQIGSKMAADQVAEARKVVRAALNLDREVKPRFTQPAMGWSQPSQKALAAQAAGAKTWEGTVVRKDNCLGVPSDVTGAIWGLPTSTPRDFLGKKVKVVRMPVKGLEAEIIEVIG